jgi:hypothetical protein
VLLIEPAYYCGAGYAHIGSDLCDRERLTIDVAKCHAQADEESFQARAKGLTRWSVSSVSETSSRTSSEIWGTTWAT